MFGIEEIGYERIDELLSLLIERAKWLIENKMKMWDIAKLTKEGMISRYGSPKVYLAFENHDIVGGFLLSEIDRNYWENAEADKAFYIHKLVVRVGFGRRGYADTMLEWIKELGKEERKTFIRLDFVKNREYLRSLYHSHGFNEIGEIPGDNGLVLVKAEYKI